MHGIIFVIVFGLLLAIIPLAVTFFLPVRQAGVFVAWLAMLAFLITLVPTGADYSPTTGLSGRVALAQMMFVPVALGVILGGGLRLFLATRDSVSLATTSPARGAEEYALLSRTMPQQIDVAMVATGALAGLCVVAGLAIMASRFQPGWAAHAPAVIAAVALWALTPWCVRRLRAPSAARWFAAGLRWSVIVVCVGAGAWTWSRIALVVDRAEAAAKDAPYCLEAATAYDRYEPVRSLLDLSPLTMRARCSDGTCWQNHAVLGLDGAGGRTLLNWSYGKSEFLHEVLTNTPKIRCLSQPHFARWLPLY